MFAPSKFEGWTEDREALNDLEFSPEEAEGVRAELVRASNSEGW